MKNTYSKIWSLIDISQRKSIFYLFLIFIGIIVFELLSIGLIIPLLTLIFDAENYLRNLEYLYLSDLFAKKNYIDTLIIILLTIILVFFLKTILIIFLQWQQKKITYEARALISKKLFTKYLNNNYNFFLNNNSSNLIRNITSECDLFAFSVLHQSISIIVDTLILLSLSLFLFIYHAKITLVIVILFILFGLIFNKLTAKYLTKWGLGRQNSEGYRIKNINEGLGSIKDIKILKKENFFINQFNYNNNNVAKFGILSDTTAQLPRPIFELIAIILVCALILYLSFNSSSSEIIILLGIYAAAAFRIMPSVTRLVNALVSINHALPVINLLYEQLNLNRTYDNKYTEENIDLSKEFLKNIEIKGLYYTYEYGSEILSNINLKIDKGDYVGIIGKTGAGKSTLINILLGLLIPKKGDFSLDGKKYSIQERKWKSLFGYVPQDIFLIDDTIKNNIAFGIVDNEIDNTKLNFAINESMTSEFLNKLPNKENTQIGQNGIRLSGGQKQRIGIARALYHNPEILIFDESTSSLDNDTEKYVLNSINRLSSKKTVIFITHRLSSLKFCNKIFELSNGSLLTKSR